jgi:transcription termination factor Rho
MPRSTDSATKSKPKPKAKPAASEKAEKPATKRTRASAADAASEEKAPKRPRTTRSAKGESDAGGSVESSRASAPAAVPSHAPVIVETRPVAPAPASAPNTQAPRPPMPSWANNNGGNDNRGGSNPAGQPGSGQTGAGGGPGGGGGRPLYQHQQQRQWANPSSQGQGGRPSYQDRGHDRNQDRGPRPSNNPYQSSSQSNSPSQQHNPSQTHQASQTMNQSNNPQSGNSNPGNAGNPGTAVMNPPQNQGGNGNGGGGYGNGGGGGGGGGMSGLSANQKKRRRKKKNKGGGDGFVPGGGGGGGGGHSGGGGGHSGGGGGGGSAGRFHQRLGVMPNDEELEREARELTEKFTPKEYAEACKKAPNIADLQKTGIEELHKIAEAEGVVDGHKFPRHELTFEILKRRAASGGLMLGAGTLDIAPDGGYGFLRSPLFSYLPSPDDVYVSASQIRRMGLRKGMELKGAVRAPKEGERFFSLLRVDEVNGGDPSRLRTLPLFEDLTPLHPEERYVLETTPDEIEMRIVDLVAPIGRGQRGLIVAPPRTGKTVLLQKMTKAIAKNYPEVKIIVLLIDERPEEVTDFRRNTHPSVEVIASTFDEDASRHVAVCEMVHEKSRRYVELGMHVVILLDSITRLARAYNAGTSHSGKIMSGGIDSNALQRPKKFFGNARAIEGGGSLTILGTALVDTGSKADEVIFEEFKGTGNSELHLDRKLVDKRIWPAIDVAASGTRREELLLDPNELELTYRLRKVLADMNVVEALELMKTRLKKCKTNAEFLMSMKMGA